MSAYLRVLPRLGILCVLALAVALMSPPAHAFAPDCFTACGDAYTQCGWDCGGLPIPPDEGCGEYCWENYQACLQGC